MRVALWSGVVVALLAAAGVAAALTLSSQSPDKVVVDLRDRNNVVPVGEEGLGELVRGAVDIPVSLPHPEDTDMFGMRLRFRPALRDGQDLRLGPADDEGNFTLAPIYGPGIQEVVENGLLMVSDGNERLYRASQDTAVLAMPAFPFGVADHARVASSRDDLALPLPTQGQLAGWTGQARQPSSSAVEHAGPAQGELVNDPALWVWLQAPGVTLRIEDENHRDGPDNFSWALLDFGGRVVVSGQEGDDGDTSTSRNPSQRDITLLVPSGAWHKLTFTGLRGDVRILDVRADGTVLYADRFDIRAGPESFRLGMSSPGGQVAFTVKHQDLPQTFTITGAHTQHQVVVTEPNEPTTIELAPGRYEIRGNTDLMGIQQPGALFWNGPADLSWPLDDGTALLTGTGTLWAYAPDGGLRIDVSKQDLNLDQGTDDLTLRATAHGQELGVWAIEDDGRTGDGGTREPAQTQRITANTGTPTVVRVDFEGSGDWVLAIESSVPKLVMSDFGVPGPLTAQGLPEPLWTPPSLHFDLARQTDLSIQAPDDGVLATWSPQGTSSIVLSSGEAGFSRQGLLRIDAGNGDLTVHGAPFSLSPAAFFHNARYQVVPFVMDHEYLRENTDYYLVDLGDYRPLDPPDEDGFYTYERTWSKDELDWSSGQVRFRLAIEGYGAGVENETATVLLEPVVITLTPTPFWERFAATRWISRLMA